MSIEVLKLKTGTVYKAVFCRNRKRLSQCFDRKIDARQWLDQQESLHAFGFKSKLSFKDAALKWYEHHSLNHKAPSSQKGDKVMIERSLIPHFGHLALDKLSPDDVDRFISALKKTGIKNVTVNRYLQVLRAILNYLIKRRYLLYNSVSIVGLLPKEDGDTFDYLSFIEADHFLRFTRAKHQEDRRWIYVVYMLAMNTGLRWGEIAALKWDRVDLERKLIIVSRTYCKPSQQIRETTKGRKTRHVGINSKLLPELQALVERRGSFDGLVFIGMNGRVLDLENFKRDFFDKDLMQAGLRRIRFHDLRHTFASHFMMKGGNLYDLQKILGHSQISMTERYAHLSPESIVTRTELVAIDGGKSNVIQLEEKRQKA